MFELNLGFDNRRLYRGCCVDEESVPGKPILKTPLDSACVIIAANMLEMVKDVPEAERDVLVLTGPVPPAIVMTAMNVVRPFFREVKHQDGRKNITEIPEPPEDLKSDLD